MSKTGEHFKEIPVKSIRSLHSLLGMDGLIYHEIETNLWAVSSELECTVVYLGTGRHGDGIVLRPLFIKDGEVWRNIVTNEIAPAGMPFHAARSR